MIKRISLLLTIAILISSLLTSFAFADNNSKKNKKSEPTPVVEISPATESLINGVPESELVTPMIVLGEPVFVSYSPSSPTSIPFFKKIAQSYVDNRGNPSGFNLGLTITSSTQQGSEWNGSVSFNTSIKTGILGEVGAQVSGGVKETREVNEAVGASGSTIVPPNTQGRLEAYYGGVGSGGSLTYRIYNTYDPDGYTQYTRPVSVEVNTDIVLDVNFLPIIW